MTLYAVLLVLALVCFTLDGLSVALPRVRLLSLGLAFLTLGLLIGHRVIDT